MEVEEDNASTGFKISSQLDPALMWYLRSGSANGGDGFKTPLSDGHSTTASDSLSTPASDGSMLRSSRTHYQHGSSDGHGSLPFRGSPRSLIENLEVTPTPAVKVEEDVLVMDGITVESVAGKKGKRSVLSESSGSSPVAPPGGVYKTDICRTWEDLLNCRYGPKCQFAHGKEELRPIRNSMRTRPEGNFCKQFAATGTCPYGPRCRFSHHLQSASPPTPTQQTSSPSRPQHTASAAAAAASKTATPMKTAAADWSPMDDGIEVALPGSSEEKPTSREEVNAYINNFLYGPTIPRKRLPVFEEICHSTTTSE